MLKHRYSSIRMKNRSEFDEGAQADEEFTKYWDNEDFVDQGGQTITPTTRTMVANVQDNAFRAYIKDWEKALLTINEATEPAARFRLATKYMNMAVFDDKLKEWRIVVDLEWPSTRSYDNKKGWVLVGELMPGHHYDDIAKAEDQADIREAFIINEAIYADIVAADSAQTRPAIKKTPAGDSDDE